MKWTRSIMYSIYLFDGGTYILFPFYTTSLYSAAKISGISLFLRFEGVNSCRSVSRCCFFRFDISNPLNCSPCIAMIAVIALVKQSLDIVQLFFSGYIQSLLSLYTTSLYSAAKISMLLTYCADYALS